MATIMLFLNKIQTTKTILETLKIITQTLLHKIAIANKIAKIMLLQATKIVGLAIATAMLFLETKSKTTTALHKAKAKIHLHRGKITKTVIVLAQIGNNNLLKITALILKIKTIKMILQQETIVIM